MSAAIKEKEKTVGGLHVRAKVNDIIYIEHNGQKLKLYYHGITDDGEAAFSFVGYRDFVIAREKILKKMGIVP